MLPPAKSVTQLVNEQRYNASRRLYKAAVAAWVTVDDGAESHEARSRLGTPIAAVEHPLRKTQ
jgi:hypothetical protein